MNRYIVMMSLIMGGIFLLGQLIVFNSKPKTLKEIARRREQLFIQLDSLERSPQRDSFSQAILKEIKTLDEQKAHLNTP